MELSDILSRLRIREILEVACQLTVPVPCQRKKSVLASFILGNLTPNIEKKLCNKLAARTSTEPATPPRKRKWDEPQPSTARKSTWMDSDKPEDDSDFLELPPEAGLKSCYRQFYDATSNAALEHTAGAVCAHERACRLDGIENIDLEDIPSPTRLVPHQTHPDHTLFHGMLLSSEGIIHREGRPACANVCQECLHDLKKTSSLPPKFLW